MVTAYAGRVGWVNQGKKYDLVKLPSVLMIVYEVCRIGYKRSLHQNTSWNLVWLTEPACAERAAALTVGDKANLYVLTDRNLTDIL